MDFEKVIGSVLKDFHELEIQYAVIGGFALGLHGLIRATVDMDFLVLVDDLEKVNGILTKYHYRRVYHSREVSQYVSDLKPFGSIDLLHAHRHRARSMLKRLQRVSLPGDAQICVAIPEDIIGMKVQALVNDPSRELSEWNDIDQLLEQLVAVKRPIDWELLEDYFKLFSRESELKEFKSKYESID